MKRRMIFSTAMLALTLTALWQFKETRVSATVETEKTVPSVVRVTPPPPIFDDAKRLAELAMRRKEVADSIGPAAMLVLFSAEPRVYTNDVDYQFRQENNLAYVVGMVHHLAVDGLQNCVLLAANINDARQIFRRKLRDCFKHQPPTVLPPGHYLLARG